MTIEEPQGLDAEITITVEEAFAAAFNALAVLATVMTQKTAATVKLLGPLAGELDPETITQAMVVLGAVHAGLAGEG